MTSFLTITLASFFSIGSSCSQILLTAPVEAETSRKKGQFKDLKRLKFEKTQTGITLHQFQDGSGKLLTTKQVPYFSWRDSGNYPDCHESLFL